RFVTDGFEADEARLIAVVVAQKIGRAAVGRQQYVKIAVVVIITVSRAAPDDGALERATRARRRLNEFGFTLAPEELRFHRVGNLRLNFINVVGDVAVGHKEVRLAVEIVIEKEEAEGQREHRRLAKV